MNSNDAKFYPFRAVCKSYRGIRVEGTIEIQNNNEAQRVFLVRV